MRKLFHISGAVALLFGLIGAALAMPMVAAAQSADPFQWDRREFTGQSVRTRPRPELDPLGIRVGSFRFYPSLGIGGRYEDNVFRSPSNEKADLVATFAPKMRLNSEFSNHSIELTAEAKAHSYATQSAEDRAEFRFAAKGRYDVARGINISGGASLARQYESRTSPDQGGSQNPVAINILSANVGGERERGRVRLGADARLDRLDFAEARRAGTRTAINNDDRDRTIGRLSAEGAYAFTPGNAAYARLEGNFSDYHDAQDDAGFDRDSVGAEARVGARLDFGGVTTGNVYIGYRAQRYEDNGAARLNDDSIDALIFGAEAQANITGLTTAYGGIERSVFESTVVGSPGGQAVRGEIGADHELLRNLLLHANLSGRWFEFEGVQRDDVGVLFQFGASYLMNRHARVEAVLEHERNRSYGARQGIDNDSNRIMLRITANP